MTSTENPIVPPTCGTSPEQAQRRARFQQLQVRLRAQRKRMDRLAASEFCEVVESIAYRLKSDVQADLIAYHVREVWQRFALSLPEGWQRDMTAYVRKDVTRDPWFRAPMAEQVPVTADHVREFAKLLVASRRHKKLDATTTEVKHG
jgi:hypothetical protein